MPAEHLVVVAHPDDEVIFFGGLIERLVSEGADVTVLCATGRFGDAWIERIRAREFQRAAERLGVRAASLDLKDAAGRLPQRELQARLSATVGRRNFGSAYTHGLLGEYGHPHHTDVCVAVHRVLPRPWSLAGPFPAQRQLMLDRAAVERKRDIARRIYESQHFAASWSTEVESFHRLPPHVVAACVEGTVVPRHHAALVAHAVRRLGDPVPAPELATIPPEAWRGPMHTWRGHLEAMLPSADRLDEVFGAARAHPADALGSAGEEGT